MEQVPSGLSNRHRENADSCRAYDRAQRVDVRDLRRDPACQRQCQQHNHEGHRRSRRPGYQYDRQPGRTAPAANAAPTASASRSGEVSEGRCDAKLRLGMRRQRTVRS
jgi:hypothetical protein